MDLAALAANGQEEKARSPCAQRPSLLLSHNAKVAPAPEGKRLSHKPLLGTAHALDATKATSFTTSGTRAFVGLSGGVDDGLTPARRRWVDALSTVRAFQLPSGGIRHMSRSIRPGVDLALLRDANTVRLAPLLSPLLRVSIPDNPYTATLTGEARLQQT